MAIEDSQDHKPDTIKLEFEVLPEAEMLKRATDFQSRMQKRRTVRDYKESAVPEEIIHQCLLTAGSAPSGANRQPWHFAVVSDPDIKKQIRHAAEKEEVEFYNSRAPQDWLDALAPLGTDSKKPFLERAPNLIVVFAQKFERDSNGVKKKNYYVTESVGIACGLLISALHNAGLATLTHTPSPMKFLNKILKRPETEKPLMLIVVGYPEDGARIPDIRRKPLVEIASFFPSQN
ncbi:MAG: nitroreductase family protein [Gammaproteobacteria bacterium]|jgi:nitroreductase|nr:nitroreductase family protein [Gammaproteobacteria bacterium]MBT3860066.1 nitroreductase family protein [Gammaproteobacteria bacterium]MBT3988515.1 nitroreductase family protein [Gammaproteobacteria bacterium]MBT4256598.1 nitroreductase family protein [Gammaproteobacteria bacterium]MBT4583185.1 nitroreductase family protein [Gammaproteobacteria bacterium]